MAAIHKTVSLDATAAEVWAAVADFGALHTRLVPGFVIDTKVDGNVRTVTFGNCTVAEEVLVDCDHARRRFVYALRSERVTQHSASVVVTADGPDRCRLEWSADLLPNEIAGYVSTQMDIGLAAMANHFAASARIARGESPAPAPTSAPSASAAR